jgi:carboxymethylenebutenolidase
MTELQRYLAEEVAEDHADGIITRREACAAWDSSG